MGSLSLAGVVLEVGNLPGSQETGPSVSCPQSLPSPHILENFEGYREISVLCLMALRKETHFLPPISGTFATPKSRDFPL